MLLEHPSSKSDLRNSGYRQQETKPNQTTTTTKKRKTKASGFLSASGRNDNYTTCTSLATTSEQRWASRSGRRHFTPHPNPPTDQSLLTCFKSFLSTWTIQLCLSSSAFIHVTMAVLSGEERKSMTDLPTSHAQLAWLEREAWISLSLPLADANTSLLSKRKHARTLRYGGDSAFPSALLAIGHIFSGTMWEMRPRQLFWMPETFVA